MGAIEPAKAPGAKKNELMVTRVMREGEGVEVRGCHVTSVHCYVAG